MSEMICRILRDGVQFRGRRDARFKTVRFSIHFITPIASETAAANAMVPYMLIRSSRSYPDYTALARHLADLYGASLNANAERHGKNQILSVSLSGISDRYALFGEKICDELIRLLCEVAFDPVFGDDGEFDPVGFEIERRQTLELIDTEYNDKRLYARRQCLSYMLEDELPCVSRFGSREAIEALRPAEVKSAWKRLLQTAHIEIMAFGDCDPETVCGGFSQAVKHLERGEIIPADTSICSLEAAGKRKKEIAGVMQSKLVMGFRTGIAPDDRKIYALRAAVALLGGTPSSKLFVNVREKMGLCYYCAAVLDRALGVLVIDSGVDPVNADKAEKAIMEQLEQIRSGQFSEDELSAAKMSLCDSYRTVEDYISGIENWYLYRTFLPEIKTPEQVSEEIMQVSREQVLEAVSALAPDTVFLLEGRGGYDGDEED